MSIRMLAQELYRAQKKVEELRRAMAASSNAATEQQARELREAERELATLQNMLDARKETSASERTPGWPRGF